MSDKSGNLFMLMYEQVSIPVNGPGPPAMSAVLGVRLDGPTDSAGIRRGIKFMEVGMIQEGQMLQQNGIFDIGTYTSTQQDGEFHIDSAGNGVGAWYDAVYSPNSAATGLNIINRDSVTPKVVTITEVDTPNDMGSPGGEIWSLIYGALDTMNLELELYDWIAIASNETVITAGKIVSAPQSAPPVNPTNIIDDTSLAQNEYSTPFEWRWEFNGSGGFLSSGDWIAASNAGNFGFSQPYPVLDPNVSWPADNPIAPETSGTLFNKLPISWT